jgi:hypothetical protein
MIILALSARNRAHAKRLRQEIAAEVPLQLTLAWPRLRVLMFVLIPGGAVGSDWRCRSFLLLAGLVHRIDSIRELNHKPKHSMKTSMRASRRRFQVWNRQGRGDIVR